MFRREKTKQESSPERYFLKYAYPCIGNLMHDKKLSKEDAQNLECLLTEHKPISREYLKSCFPSAFRRIKQVAGEMKMDYWSVAVLRKYWLEEHNRFIDAGEGDYAKATPSFKELCKVYEAKVIARKDNLLTVSYDGVKRKVLATLVPEAREGDTVTVHLAFAVEKIN